MLPIIAPTMTGTCDLDAPTFVDVNEVSDGLNCVGLEDVSAPSEADTVCEELYCVGLGPVDPVGVPYETELLRDLVSCFHFILRSTYPV